MRFARDLVRSAEWHRVRDFAQQVRASPAALAIQGEAGAGKSTLWRAGIGAAAAAGYRLLRSEPSASETDLSFAGLSDLLAEISPLTEAGIPGPQLEALQVALQLRPAGDKPPTAHAVGLAVLAALRGCLSRHPLLIVIDDVQWLDDATREVVTFALRRLSSGPLSLLVAARTEAVADPLTAGVPQPSRAWQELLAAVPVVEAIDLAPLDMWQIQNLLPRAAAARHPRPAAGPAGEGDRRPPAQLADPPAPRDHRDGGRGRSGLPGPPRPAARDRHRPDLRRGRRPAGR
jgi:hypothetical protein